MPNHKGLINQILNTPKEELSLDFVKQLKREFSKKNNLKDIVSNIQILREYHKLVKNGEIEQSDIFESLLKKRAIRSQSGIVSVQVLTKPFGCPGQCIFCPNDTTMPKSYIKTEPGAMRALLNQFDPYKQVWNRLLSLTLTGHKIDKIEMIVLGGTRDVYPDDYKIDFIKSLYDACNTFSEYFKKVEISETEKYKHSVKNIEEIKLEKNREKAIKKNESADHRIIGLTIETRPEFVTDKTCRERRNLGITRIEMGVQSMYNRVLDANKRGHGVKETQEACHKMRQYGFKFSIHIMPGLYKSSIRKDIKTFQKIFSDPFIKPDELKFYPTSVIPNTELNKLFETGKYKPLTTKSIKYIIEKVLLKHIPAYTRIKRLIRDIPATEIVAGSNVTNLSQLVHGELKKRLKNNRKTRKKLYKRLYPNDKYITTTIQGDKPNLEIFRNFVSLDTRSREMRNRCGDRRKLSHSNKKTIGEAKKLIVTRKYISSVGIEYFVGIEDELGYLYGFIRLLLPKTRHTIDIKGLGKNTAIIRELHVYGNLTSLKKTNTKDGNIQHTGLGKQLMGIAEEISNNYNYQRLSVISGVGVRKYYEKLGYKLEGTYMLKELN